MIGNALAKTKKQSMISLPGDSPKDSIVIAGIITHLI